MSRSTHRQPALAQGNSAVFSGKQPLVFMQPLTLLESLPHPPAADLTHLSPVEEVLFNQYYHLKQALEAQPGLPLAQKQLAGLRNQLVALYTKYVKKIATGLARRSTDPVEDLIQVGCIGLLKALDKYNPAMKTRFKTYATYFITGEIRHYLRDKTSMIKAPRQMYELYYRMNLIVQELTDRLGRVPTDVEIAQELQCPLAKVQEAQVVERRRHLVSLDAFMNAEEGDESHYLERLVDESSLEQLHLQEDRLLLEQAMSYLNRELKAVIEMTFYQDLSQTEIARQLNISQMQVSRRLKKALGVLQGHLQGAPVRMLQPGSIYG